MRSFLSLIAAPGLEGPDMLDVAPKRHGQRAGWRLSSRTRGSAMSDRLSAREEQAVAYAPAHLAAIAFIERNLFEPKDLARVARAAGDSASEFSRRFTQMQGESVMAYVRGRRLETAAARILADPQARLIDLAIECGFTSQAAFTRAF